MDFELNDEQRMIRDLAREEDWPIGILQDLPGPKIRVGDFPGGPVDLKAGQEFVLTIDGADGALRGENEVVEVTSGCSVTVVDSS